MAKIAVELNRALALKRERGSRGGTTSRPIARGTGWTVADVVCTHGPQDQPYEEHHSRPTIAVVLAGSFQYQCPAGYNLMTPGALLLGSTSRCFRCRHDHGEGDRCVAFTYDAEFFERLVSDLGTGGHRSGFTVAAVPALTRLAPLTARVAAGALGVRDVPWDELAISLAIQTIRVTTGTAGSRTRPVDAEARVSRVVRAIARDTGSSLPLDQLSREAGLSPYYFLRTFERITGLTPHQYVRRARLREAATRLLTESGKVLDVALDCGFGDVSNFNRAFRSEFGVSPRQFRKGAR